MNKFLVIALFALSGAVCAEPAINFDCTGENSGKQQCTVSFDRERIEKAFEPVEKQAQSVNSPSEAMQVMSNALTVFAAILSSK